MISHHRNCCSSKASGMIWRMKKAFHGQQSLLPPLESDSVTGFGPGLLNLCRWPSGGSAENSALPSPSVVNYRSPDFHTQCHICSVPPISEFTFSLFPFVLFIPWAFYFFAVSCQSLGLRSPHPHSSFLNTTVGWLLVFCAIWRENYFEHYQSVW